MLVALAAAAVLPSMQSCSDEWLEPKPLSQLTVNNLLDDYETFSSLIPPCESNMRLLLIGKLNPMCVQMMQSDLCVCGRPDWTAIPIDMDKQLTPQYPGLSLEDKKSWYHMQAWKSYWRELRFAGALISRIKVAEDNITQEQYDFFLANGYFFRSWVYYNMVNEYGDVPWMEGEPSQFKTDYYSYDRWSILEAIEKEAKFAYEHLPEKVDRGQANKWGAGVLYMKILMCNNKYDEAIAIGDEIITANPLMTTRMNTSKPNLQMDLHCYESKFNPKNTEGLYYTVDYVGSPRSNDDTRSCVTRQCSAYWNNPIFTAPNGRTGVGVVISQSKLAESEFDNDFNYNLGQGCVRPSVYYGYELWTKAEANDERGRFNKDNWKGTWDLYYNQKAAGDYYCKHIEKPENMSVADTMQSWFAWPHYKVYVPHPTYVSAKQGGDTPWYVYRTAEVYQLVAECYYWKGDLEKEKEYLNVVRKRAKADPYTTVTGIKEVLDERARELYHEELRHNELVRISFAYASTGKYCEATGYTYNLDKFSGNGGDNECLKENGYNFYYDWVVAHNGIFNKGIIISDYEYRMSVHHVLWPIPEAAIKENCTGVINQTPGYITSLPRVKPRKVK